MKTLLVILLVVALAAPGAALLMHACNSSARIAWEDQPQPPIRDTRLDGVEAPPAAGTEIIDDEGMPLFIPVRAG